MDTACVASALCLGFYDVFKKLSVAGNNVLVVLFLNTLFSSLLMAPVIIASLADGYIGLGGSLTGHFRIMVKALIVLSSWLLGYFSIAPASHGSRARKCVAPCDGACRRHTHIWRAT